MTKIFSTKQLNNSFSDCLAVDFQSADFIRITFLERLKIPLQGALIITSQNTIKSLEHNGLISILKDRSIFCVGTQTKQQLEEKGFNQIALNAPSATTLADLIIDQIDNTQPLIYLCGHRHRPELPNKLIAQSFGLENIITYQTTLTPLKLSYQPDALLFFSPSAVESYLSKNQIRHAQCFCIGPTTHDILKPYTHRVLTSKEPSLNAMMNLLNQWLLNL